MIGKKQRRFEARRKPKFLRSMLIGVSSMALVLTACADTGGTSGAGADGTTELVIAQAEDVQTFDPHMFRGRATQYVLRQIMTPLVEINNEMDVVPALATEWEQVEETTWEVTLREGITFTNGEVLDAEAVKWNFDRVLDPDLASPRRGLVVSLESVEVVDDLTLHMHTSQPDGAFPLALAYIEMAPPAYFEEVGPEAFSAAPVGTGPYTFVSNNPGRGIIMERNDDYFGEASKVDRLVVRVIPEVASRIAALQSGEAHIISHIPADLAGTIGGNATTVSAPGTEVWHVAMNVDRGNFSDKEIRQAMQMAINPQEIAETVFEGLAEPLNQPAFENQNCYNPNFEGYEYDPEAAAEVLGALPAVTIDTIESEKHAAEAIAGQLRQAGLSVNVNSMEDGAFLARINGGDSELYLHSWAAGRGTCDELWRQHFHSSTREGHQFTG